MRKYRSIFFFALKGLTFANKGNNSHEAANVPRGA
jgi:hypothetical protein